MRWFLFFAGRAMSRPLHWLLVILATVACAPRAAADELALRNGTRLVGELLTEPDRPGGSVRLRTPEGVEVDLPREQVAGVQRTAPARAEYEYRAVRTPNTVEAQLELAQWCRDHKLSAERELHLRQVLELDPDHAETRRSLGYQRVADGWYTRQELQSKLGYVRYDGRWRTAQEVAILERREKDEKAATEWAVKVGRWRKWLDGPRADEAHNAIAQISDPYAVTALVKLCDREVNPNYRLLYVQTLAQIESPEAIQALMRYALTDRETEVREASLDELVRRKSPEMVSSFVKSLRSKDNAVVNRAAYALGRLGDPAAVGPLIDALFTRHRFKVQQPAGGTNASFARPGTTGTSAGGGWGPAGMSMGGGPKFVDQNLRNPAALDALVSITGGVNFEYNTTAWNYWFAQQRKQQEIQARRDSAPQQ